MTTGHGFEPLDEDLIYEGYVMTISKGRFRAPDGTVFERDVMRHPGAVAVLPLDGDEVVLLRQYRSALNAVLWEIPAGLRDVEGEPPEQTAQRELIEEVGLRAGSLELLTSIHNAVGYSDEQIHIFLGTDLEAVERELTTSPEELEMEIVRMPISQAETMITSGEITDGKTVIGILAALRR